MRKRLTKKMAHAVLGKRVDVVGDYAVRPGPKLFGLPLDEVDRRTRIKPGQKREDVPERADFEVETETRVWLGAEREVPRNAVWFARRDWRRVCSAAFTHAANDDTRPAVHRIAFDGARAWSTDGHRLYAGPLPLQLEGLVGRGVLPIDFGQLGWAADRAVAWVEPREPDALGHDRLVVKCSGFVASSPILYEGGADSGPNRVIPNHTGGGDIIRVTGLGYAQLHELLAHPPAENLTVIIERDAVRFEAHGNGWACKTYPLAAGSITLPDGAPEARFGLNACYLLDAVEAVHDGAVTLEIAAPSRPSACLNSGTLSGGILNPVLIGPNERTIDRDGPLAVVMPVRL